jgi:epoxyqueuosine reductase
MTVDLHSLPAVFRTWALELGFGSLGIADTQLSDMGPQLTAWLDAGMHGSMDYMARSINLRLDPSQLVPNTCRAIMVTMPYTPSSPEWVEQAWANLSMDERAFVARYALGRDYHKVVRSRLQKLATQISQRVGQWGYRVFCDSAPVMEVELARRAGLGWRGKHTLLLSQDQGSMFFIGSILTDLPIPTELTQESPASSHCGRCQACIDICPTQAIVAPYVLDARRCISYLTIEHAGSIDPALRPLMGNRIYGCDDCQLACPWNKFAAVAGSIDFAARNNLDASTLSELFAWTEAQFNDNFAGSPIRRIGHERWLRNIAVALGNCTSLPAQTVVAILQTHNEHANEIVREHVQWAIEQQIQRNQIAASVPT